ncbi:hypothetical protein CAPTEDRAFT_206376 [Capitella teleta]|uniref:G-protein coupled receptors family 1 profile domain-containing protein n=1 Tax=Capitella teleta TaxID=283909 RepID=R7VK61_CAPTE|nr:hypothetical protein CAPTEDRAFT_206376 [Capitella teleta]|eukprot:ELU17066.1 hypothetical protein CAPTEDRAFT_206376 [Capitella teleta]
MSSTEAHTEMSSTDHSWTEELPKVNLIPSTKHWNKWAVLHVEIVCFVGFVLNLITLLACWRASILKNGKPVHLFIFNIMLTDILTIIVVQPWLAFYFIDDGITYIKGDEWGCLSAVVIAIFALETSYYGVLLLTVERFIAIAFPLQHMHRVTKTVCKTAIAVSWAVVFVKNGVLYVCHPYDSEFKSGCVPRAYMYAGYVNAHNAHLYTVLALITVINVMIAGIVIGMTKNRAALRSNNEDMKNARRRGELKMVKMLFCVVIALFFTWMPFNVVSNIVTRQRLLGRPIDYNIMVATLMIRGFNFLGAVADPLLYIWQNPGCRKAVAKLFVRRSNNTLTQPPTISASVPPN